jgi:hypothetical protein
MKLPWSYFQNRRKQAVPMTGVSPAAWLRDLWTPRRSGL